jgi:protein-L-isoaspartate O-methyltransferase
MPSFANTRGSRARVLPLGLPVFGAAGLLFLVEPMLAKLLLPSLGGSPATWASCLVAFQLLLLCGYGYVYLGARFLSARQQAGLHSLLLGVAVVSLWRARLGAPPELSGLPPSLAVPRLVLARVGVPYAILASTAPLLSRWSNVVERPFEGLYAVSNAGALLGLLAYPFLLERFVALPVQLALWQAGFVLFVLALLPIIVVTWRRGGDAAAAAPSARASARSNVRWFLCACLPSALLLAATNYISIDVAATPLLWVLPLALYLASFVVAFSAWGSKLRGAALVAWLVGTGWTSLNALGQGAVPLFAQVAAALLALFGASLLCHIELARERPSSTESSGYYLILATGGVVGGAFVSLLAPAVFDDFYELELTTIALFVLLLGLARRDAGQGSGRGIRLGLYLGCGVCVPLVVGEAVGRHAWSGGGGHVVERRRGFLGTLRVVDVAEGRVLTHGRIQHGMQLRAPDQRRTPTMYFGPHTGVRRALDRYDPEHPRTIGVVGLGVGTLAVYAGAHETLRFYELDPNVVELAQHDFTFLEDSPARVSIVVGDGRLSLAREAPHAFDVLVLDAFSSDAVPVHLLTREAFEVYGRQLADHGVLVANVTNRHLDVDRVVRASAEAIGLSCTVVETPTDAIAHVTRVVWAVMARDPAQVAGLVGDLPVRHATEPDVLWTDSRASVLSVLR